MIERIDVTHVFNLLLSSSAGGGLCCKRADLYTRHRTRPDAVERENARTAETRF
jgi:hypothetical protein